MVPVLVPVPLQQKGTVPVSATLLHSIFAEKPVTPVPNIRVADTNMDPDPTLQGFLFLLFTQVPVPTYSYTFTESDQHF
jgi:hypothetical protein